MNFLKYLKAVGTGPKHNHNLTREEIFDAMDLILSGQVSSEVIGAFLLGWRVKGETIDEFHGALDAFQKYINITPIPNSIELGYPYDGKSDNPYIFPLVGQYLEHFNINLVLCADNFNHAKQGITIHEIANLYSFTENVHIFDRKKIFPEITSLNSIRENLHIRTSLNSIEKLIGFTKSKVGVLGAFHKPFIDKYINVYKNRYERFAVVKGNEGSLEIFGKCKLWICKNNYIEEITIDPSDFKIKYEKSWEKITLEESFSLLNNPSDELLKLAKLNAAIMLYIYNDDYKNIYEAYETIDVIC